MFAVEERVAIFFPHVDIDLSDAPFPLCHGGHIVGFLETQQNLARHTDGVGEVGGIGRLVIEITVVAEERADASALPVERGDIEGIAVVDLRLILCRLQQTVRLRWKIEVLQ